MKKNSRKRDENKDSRKEITLSVVNYANTKHDLVKIAITTGLKCTKSQEQANLKCHFFHALVNFTSIYDMQHYAFFVFRRYFHTKI